MTALIGLCIGGPKDGQQVTILDRPNFVVQVPGQYLPSQNVLIKKVEINTVVYHYEQLVCDGEIIFSLWLPEGTPLKAALKTMYLNYKPGLLK